jgi:hypothetical protein
MAMKNNQTHLEALRAAKDESLALARVANERKDAPRLTKAQVRLKQNLRNTMRVMVLRSFDQAFKGMGIDVEFINCDKAVK